MTAYRGQVTPAWAPRSRTRTLHPGQGTTGHYGPPLGSTASCRSRAGCTPWSTAPRSSSIIRAPTRYGIASQLREQAFPGASSTDPIFVFNFMWVLIKLYVGGPVISMEGHHPSRELWMEWHSSLIERQRSLVRHCILKNEKCSHY